MLLAPLLPLLLRLARWRLFPVTMCVLIVEQNESFTVRLVARGVRGLVFLPAPVGARQIGVNPTVVCGACGG